MQELIQGDCLQVMRELLQDPHQFELAYLDPPFMTQRDFTTTDGAHAFSDRWVSREQYITYIRERAHAAWQLLSLTGSLVLHVDWRTSHYLRVALDEDLDGKLQNEIIWSYRRWPSKTQNLQHMHDTLLHYARDDFTFSQLYEDLAPSTRKQWGTKRQVARTNALNVRTHSEASNVESLGVPLRDVWDIGIIAPSSKERTGYPTQKPQPLLRRLVQVFTQHGDSVLDPFCGSGAMLRACEELGRSGLGIDQSPEAVACITSYLPTVRLH